MRFDSIRQIQYFLGRKRCLRNQYFSICLYVLVSWGATSVDECMNVCSVQFKMSFFVFPILPMIKIDMANKQLVAPTSKSEPWSKAKTTKRVKARHFWTGFPFASTRKVLGNLFLANLHLLTRAKHRHALSIAFSGVSFSWYKLLMVVYSKGLFSFIHWIVSGPANRCVGR